MLRIWFLFICLMSLLLVSGHAEEVDVLNQVLHLLKDKPVALGQSSTLIVTGFSFCPENTFCIAGSNVYFRLVANHSSYEFSLDAPSVKTLFNQTMNGFIPYNIELLETDYATYADVMIRELPESVRNDLPVIFLGDWTDIELGQSYRIKKTREIITFHTFLSDSPGSMSCKNLLINIHLRQDVNGDAVNVPAPVDPDVLARNRIAFPYKVRLGGTDCRRKAQIMLTDDREECRKEADPALADQCWSRMARRMGDESYCERIILSVNKEQCFQQYETVLP